MDDKKTVCIVMGGHFSSTIGGAQYQAQCIVDGLIQTGRYNVYYLTREFDPEYRPHGYEIVKIADSSGIRKHGYIFDTRRLLKLLYKLKPDYIYQRGLKAYTGVIAKYAKRSHCKAIFHIAHDYNLMPLRMRGASRLYWLRWIEKRLGEYGLKNIDAVVAQTREQANLLQQNYGRRASAVIPNFHPFPSEEIVKDSSPHRVLWVANFKPVKRPELFVRLARELAERDDIVFTMIGRPGEEERYVKLHDEIGKMTNLQYLGEKPIQEVNQHLAQSHIFVNTSRAEGFPNTFIQAWMRKVPTLSLDIDPDGVLAKQRIGYCAGSIEELKKRVIELCDNPQRREKMGIEAQRYAFDEHSPHAMQKLITLMDD